MGLVRPHRVVGSRVDDVAVLVDAVVVVRAGEQLDVVAVVAPGVAGDAVLDLEAVLEVPHVGLQLGELVIHVVQP